MSLSWGDASTTVFGLLITKQISPGAIRPEIFFGLYADAVKAYKNGVSTPEEIISMFGQNMFSSALEAAQSVNGLSKTTDWIKILEGTHAKYEAGVRAEKLGRKLQLGEDVNYAEFTDLSRKAQASQSDDFTPVSEVSPQENSFIETGFYPFDEHLGGIPVYGVTVLGAFPKAGKTFLACKLAHCFATKHPDKIVAFFTLEMYMSQLAKRFQMINAPEDALKRILLCEKPVTVEEVLNKASTIDNLGLIIVDFSDLLIRGEVSESQVSHIYQTLAIEGKSLYVPKFIISQISGVPEGIPTDTQYRYSKTAVKAFASLNLMIYNPHEVAQHTDRGKTLPIFDDAAYVCCWSSREGFPLHERDSPGAILIPWKRGRGWANKKGTKWFVLEEEKINRKSRYANEEE